jgi:hypothetical protein
MDVEMTEVGEKLACNKGRKKVVLCEQMLVFLTCMSRNAK